MSCSYRIGGVENQLLNDVFFYIEDTNADTRAAFKIEDILEKRNIAFRDENELFLVDMPGTQEDIGNINEAARAFFGVMGDLVKRTRVGNSTRLEVDDNIMRLLSPSSNIQNTSVNNTTMERLDEVDDVVGEDPLISEAFARKQKVNDITDKIVSNLERQIERLQRLEQSDPVKKRTNELNLLKRKLRSIKKGRESVENYYDYVDYVYNLTQRATTFMNNVEDKYAVSYKTMPNEDRAEILRDISELKQTLDAFYVEEREISVIDQLERRLIDMRDQSGVKEEMLDKVIISMANMRDLNDRYLEIAIPIQADVLLEYAPLEVNKTLNATIERLQKAYDEGNYDIPFQGLRKRDPRALKIYKEVGLVRNSRERRRQLLQLNIQQLQEQLIGRDHIIRELRETHQDASAFSMYADPLVYSSELNIQLFGNVIKAELMAAHQKTIDSKYDLEPAFKKFRDWKGGKEDQPGKMYEDILEVLNINQKQADGTFKTVRALAFVQPYDMNKFKKAQEEAFELFRKQHNYPEDPADLDDFFASADGRLYNAAVAEWYRDNTDPLDGRDGKPSAQDIVDEMIRERNNIDAARSQAFRDGREQEGKELSYQYHALDLEIKKVYRQGKDGFQIVGKLTKPKDALYANPKYTNMAPEAKEYLNILLNIYRVHQRKLGIAPMLQNPWDEFSYLLPSIRKSAVEEALEGNVKNSAINLLSDSIMLQETDTEFGELVESNGERMQFVPRYFTNLVDEALVSRDATNSIIKFLDMANRYEAKAKMLGVVNVMKDSVASRDVKVMLESGNYLLDRTAQKLGYNLERKTKGKDSKTYKQLESFIDNVIFGETIKGNARASILGKISVSKLVGQATALTALSRLSGNVLQAVNQLTIDSVMNASEGWAGQFFSRKDLARARYKVMASMSTEGLAPKFNKVTKLNKMLEMFDVMQEGAMTFDQSTGTAARKAVDFGTSFAFQRGAEWFNTAEKMMALAISMEGKLLDKSGKVIKTKDGKPANLWDVMQINKKGRLVVDPKVANFGKAEQARFAAKLNGLVKRTNQLKGQFDKTILERQNATRPMMLFRKFLVPAYRKRFGHKAGGYHVDVELGDITEGYYTTMFRSFGAAGRLFVKGKVAESIRTLVGRGGTQGKVERANMIRAAHEQAYLTLLKILTGALGAMMDDDDEYDNYATHFLIYQGYRLQTELNAFRDPNELFRLMENPTAASKFLKDLGDVATSSNALLWNQLGFTALYPDEDVYYQRRAGRYQKGDLKWFKELEDVFPVASGLIKSTNPEQASKYYQINK
tara:strand:- start:2812 stop:6678 length:3867 start_codon:yes stop_codon:yes gene_type:complete